MQIRGMGVVRVGFGSTVPLCNTLKLFLINFSYQDKVYVVCYAKI